MSAVSFVVEKRESNGTGPAKELRRSGFVPGVVYGQKKEVISVKGELAAIEKLYYTAGESTVIELVIGNDKKENVLIQDASFDPVSDRLTHIDFIRIDMKKEVEAIVPIKFVDISPAEKRGGTFLINKDAVTIKCLPSKLVHDIVISKKNLTEYGHVLTVADLEVGEGVVILDDSSNLLAQMIAPKVKEAASQEAGGVEA
jgi:large subunit ribosomal protein L25